ncbi:MAG: hypothetical protein GWN93_02915 [Deltaproteobacteria bacterium]|nr:hypothetical protein [Deltaproteobacteria bacterium]
MTTKIRLIIDIELNDDGGFDFSIQQKGKQRLRDIEIIKFMDEIKYSFIEDLTTNNEILKEKLNRIEHPEEYKKITN